MKSDANSILREKGEDALRDAFDNAENPFVDEKPQARERGKGAASDDTSAKRPSGPRLDCAPWWRDAATIPPRPFLYGGKHYARKYIGASIGSGGRLKTSHGLFEAIEMTSGRDLTTGVERSDGPLRVLFLNAEEDQDELDRRLAAICLRYNISEPDLGGRLFIKSARDDPLRFATMVRGTATLNEQALAELGNFIKSKQIDIFMLDPWVSFHAVRESENTDMDLVIKQGLGRIANETNSAGEIFHHPGKPKPGQDTTVEDARGASAIILAARSARVFNFMTSNEAEKLGITEDDRWRYIRISNGKANMGPIGKANWIKIEAEIMPSGEEVACSTRWNPPNPFEGVSVDDMQGGAKLAQGGALRANSQSPQWYGWALADMLKIPISYGADNNVKDVARVKTIIKTWIGNKVLKVVDREDERRRKKKYIVPGSASPYAKADADDANGDEGDLDI